MDTVWLKGDYKAIVVPEEQQEAYLGMVDAQNLHALNQGDLAKLAIPYVEGRYYYLVQAGFIGEPWRAGRPRVPAGVKAFLSVTSEGVAYVFTARLTRQEGVGSMAVVIQSEVPVTSVHSNCGAVG
ncbi:MAG: hypothetical protein JHC88_11285 [Niveispirillum sp.]|nr:hypothetical protein [Niveispirillum sp.]